MYTKQTKIVCTIAHNRCEPEFIEDLFDAGMNVARLNTAHIEVEDAAETGLRSATGLDSDRTIALACDDGAGFGNGAAAGCVVDGAGNGAGAGVGAFAGGAWLRGLW